MKKILSLFLIITAILVTGCTLGQEQGRTPSQKQQSQQGALTSQPSPDTSQLIGTDKAKEIALQKAGLTADAVRFDRVELDYDDRNWRYEVEFRQGSVEYEADIKADDGTILSWGVDAD